MEISIYRNVNTKRKVAKLLDSSTACSLADGLIMGSHNNEEIISVPEAEKNEWCYFLLNNNDIRTLNDILRGKTLLMHDAKRSMKYKVLFQTFVYTMRDHLMRIENCSYVKKRTQTQSTEESRLKEPKNENKIHGGGFLFVHAPVEKLNKVLNLICHRWYPARDINTNKVAIIPDSQMQSFIKLYEALPCNVQIMEQSIQTYAQNRQRVRVTAGVLEGTEGYIIRMHRDHHFVFSFGNMTFSINDIRSFPIEKIE